MRPSLEDLVEEHHAALIVGEAELEFEGLDFHPGLAFIDHFLPLLQDEEANQSLQGCALYRNSTHAKYKQGILGMRSRVVPAWQTA